MAIVVLHQDFPIHCPCITDQSRLFVGAFSSYSDLKQTSFLWIHVAVEQLIRKCTESARSIRGQKALKYAVKHNQKLNKYMDYRMKYFHKMWGQSHERFVWKCAASSQSIIGRCKFNGVWPNLNQIWGTSNDNPNKFVQNARKVFDQSKARKGSKFNGV